MMLRNWIFVVIASLSSACGTAAVWYVHPAGSAEQTGSPSEPFATLQQALAAVGNGDTVILLPGVYTGVGNYDLAVSGLSLTLRSADPNDWNVVETTVIDPNLAGSVFAFANIEGRIAIEGLTIQNAFIESQQLGGAAIYCEDVDILIRHCVFLNCQSDGLGGAIYLNNSQAAVSNSIFAGNAGWHGGALFCDNGSAVQMEHCTLAGNSSLFNGGGIACEFNITLTIDNSILWGNRATQNSVGHQLSLIDQSIAQIDYSAIEDGVGGTYRDSSSTLTLGTDILDADPLFVFCDPEESTLTWDLRLKSQYGRWNPAGQAWVSDAVTSPCIDAGDVNTDYRREPWPNGRRANIGAFGNTEQASRFGNRADLNADGRVDLQDVAQLASCWQTAPNDYQDIDQSGTVDLGDLVLLAADWLWQRPF